MVKTMRLVDSTFPVVGSRDKHGSLVVSIGATQTVDFARHPTTPSLLSDPRSR